MESHTRRRVGKIARLQALRQPRPLNAILPTRVGREDPVRVGTAREIF